MRDVFFFDLICMKTLELCLPQSASSLNHVYYKHGYSKFWLQLMLPQFTIYFMTFSCELIIISTAHQSLHSPWDKQLSCEIQLFLGILAKHCWSLLLLVTTNYFLLPLVWFFYFLHLFGLIKVPFILPLNSYPQEMCVYKIHRHNIYWREAIWNL